MDKSLVEEIARTIHRLYGKEMLGELQKWENRPAVERSTWRLIARTAIDLVNRGDSQRPKGAAKITPAANPRQFGAIGAIRRRVSATGR